MELFSLKRNEYYALSRENGKPKDINYFRTCEMLTELKKEKDRLYEISNSGPQHILRKHENAFTAFFSKKQILKVHKTHQQIRDARKDFNRKVSAAIANHYGTVVLEDLNIHGLRENHNLAKSISDQGWKPSFKHFRSLYYSLIHENILSC